MGTDYTNLDLPLQQRNWRKCGLRFLIAPPGSQEPQKQGTEQQPDFAPPEPWLSQWNRLAARPCPLLWSYFELGPDLLTSGPCQRLALFSKICASLKIPQEWIVFWPLAENTAQGLKPRLDIFWQGVDWIQPAYLVIFGQQAMRLLYSEQTREYGLYLQFSPAVLYLPGPADMLPDNRPAKSYVWQMLLKLQKGLKQD